MSRPTDRFGVGHIPSESPMNLPLVEQVPAENPVAQWLRVGLIAGAAAVMPLMAHTQTLAPRVQAAPAAGVAATVNGEALPAQHAEWLLNDQLARGAADTPALRARVRESLIQQALMAQAATREGLEDQPDVRARLALARQHALAQAWQQQVVRGVQITEDDLVAEYQRQVQALGTQEVQLRHVLLADEQQARQVHAQIAGGAPFEAVAAGVSLDNSTRERGGLSDWVPVGSLAPGIAQAVNGLPLGALAPLPIETPSGWQVVRLEGQRPFAAAPLASVLGPLRSTLEQRALQARLAALRTASQVD